MSSPDPNRAFADAIATAQRHVDAAQWAPAIAALEEALALRPDASGAWRALGDAHNAAGDPERASPAHVEAARLALLQPPLADAVAAIEGDRLASAEAMVRARLKSAPTDIAAIMLLAVLAQRAGKIGDAIRFLRRALEIAPGARLARETLARLFYQERLLPEAAAEFDWLLADDPAHPGYRTTRAAIMDQAGDPAGAAAIYRAMLREDAGQPGVWVTLGDVSNTGGDLAGAVAAYRRSVALAPNQGDGWWGLANLKSFRFDEAEIATMRAQLARPDLAAIDRLRIDFALGKALEDRADYAGAFAHYAAGNAAKAAIDPHVPTDLAALTARCQAFFTPAFFAARADAGDPAPDPIFVLGLPRSGSTLVEQMLASHPAIEGTMELPELPRIARALGGLGPDPASAAYPDSLGQLAPAQFAAIGARYLERAARWRRTDRPFFIDKFPLNFVSIGLIRLILPRARIIDVRRHPIGCGLSIFKQYWPNGASFSSDLRHIGGFYADYVRMMAVWDAALPGAVHHVVYEDLVADPEAAVRGMLDHLGLAFDPACLAFHANPRAVRTPSAEQVRRPIDAAAAEHWRHFEPWLAPMVEALGDVATHWRP